MKKDNKDLIAENLREVTAADTATKHEATSAEIVGTDKDKSDAGPHGKTALGLVDRTEKTADGEGKVAIPELLTVTPAPHIRHRDNTTSIMLDVVFALLPALAWGTYVFGIRALLVCLITSGSCIIFEYLTQRILKRPVTIADCSALVTGLLLGMNLPATAPAWLAVVGSAFAIIVVKQIFGGLGHNVFNPALAARVFLSLAWPTQMTAFTAPFARLLFSSADAVTSATPLVSLNKGVLPGESLLDMLLGSNGGTIGEVSALFLLLGGIYLLVRKVISWYIPVSYIGTVALLTFILPRGDIGRLDYMLYSVLAGGLIIGAFFMATDYVTSPVTPRGRLIFGAGAGLIVVFIRYFGGYPEGVSFSILIMNSLVWYIEKISRPHVFGGVKKHGKKA